MVKKPAKKKAAKQAATKKKPAKKKVVAKKPVNKTAKKPVKKTAKKPAKKTAKKKAVKKPAKKAAKTKAVKKPAKKKATKKTPAMKKSVAKKKPAKKAVTKKAAVKKIPAAKKVPKKAAKKKVTKRAAKKASATDLWNAQEEEFVDKPKKTPYKARELKMFRKMLLELRDRIVDEVKFLSGDNLNRSQRDSSGDLSSYSFHMADQGTDNWDREFALSMVSSEQDVIYEIEEALRRIEEKTYGVCEITGNPIELERLKAIPHTRHSLKAQAEIEKNSGRRYRHDPR